MDAGAAFGEGHGPLERPAPRVAQGRVGKRGGERRGETARELVVTGAEQSAGHGDVDLAVGEQRRCGGGTRSELLGGPLDDLSGRRVSRSASSITSGAKRATESTRFGEA